MVSRGYASFSGEDVGSEIHRPLIDAKLEHTERCTEEGVLCYFAGILQRNSLVQDLQKPNQSAVSTLIGRH